MRSRPVVVAAVVALACALAGCTPAAPHGSTSPSASATPVFASDADALKAAETAYAAYLKVSDEVAHDGGANPERLKGLVTKARYEAELRSSSNLSRSGLHTVGATRFDQVQLQQVTDGPSASVTFYTCWDASAVRVIDGQGSDVTPANRQDRQMLEIVLATAGGKHPLVLKSDDLWSQGSC